ncbi:hypothetical protein [Spirochaeta lutea]|nr:hypothetical protein [Spirochaeta lutea]
MMGFSLVSMFFPLALLAAGGIGLALYIRRRRRKDAPRLTQGDLQARIFRVAREHRGRLTVSQAAADLGMSPGDAEALLLSVSDGLRVKTEVSDQGLLYFEFTELIEGPPNPSGL